MNILIAFMAGLLSFFSPCIFPLVPAFLCYMAGVSCSDQNKNNIWQIFWHAVFYVIGFGIVFTLLGSALVGIGFLLRDKAVIIRQISGIFIILLGFHFLFDKFLPFLNASKKINLKINSKFPLLNSLVLGMLFAVGWTPCVGPALASILILASTTHSIYFGTLLLAFYSLGLGIPFIAMALLMNLSLKINAFISKNLEKISKISGFFLIILGIIIMFGGR